MDAGGDLIITQLFYDVDIFLKFVADCRAIGISQPIVPGIMPIVTYAGFKRMTGFCKTKVTELYGACTSDRFSSYLYINGDKVVWHHKKEKEKTIYELFSANATGDLNTHFASAWA